MMMEVHIRTELADGSLNFNDYTPVNPEVLASIRDRQPLSVVRVTPFQSD